MSGSEIRPTNPRELAEAYDAWYSQWDLPDAELDNSLFPWHEAALDIAGNVFKGRSVLEIGCGSGRLTRELGSRGASEVIGIDISETALRIARRRAQGLTALISFRRGDIEVIPVSDERFPVVFCCETIEHVLNPRRALSELRRVLAPEGTLVLTAPNYLSLAGLHRLSVRARGRPFSEGGQPVNNVTMWPRTALWVRRAGFRLDRLSMYRLLLPRRRAEPKELSPPAPIYWLFWPFRHESAIRATRYG